MRGSNSRDLVRLILAMGMAALLCCACKDKPKPAAPEQRSLDVILASIQQLENNRDPKCHATASRLEDFMYGTPLTDKARFRKMELQKEFARQLWQRAGELSNDQKASPLTKAQVTKAALELVPSEPTKDGIQLPIDGAPLLLTFRDLEHYGSIAYALRAILAVEQETLGLPPLDESSVQTLARALDVKTLAALQLADKKARAENRYQLRVADIETAWGRVGKKPKASDPSQKAQASGDRGVFRSIVDQKLQSYTAYNDISQQVFVRNVQVYYARLRWPEDPKEQTAFRDTFTKTMVGLAGDIEEHAVGLAKKDKEPFLRPRHVYATLQHFCPFSVNQFEDVTFFPNLEKNEQVTLEAYDTDSYRDSGLHWLHWKHALDDKKLQLEPDPFAAELLAEGLAQLAVLTFRVAGQIAEEQDEKALKEAHLKAAVARILQRVAKHRGGGDGETREAADTDLSSTNSETRSDDPYFTDVTEASGIDFTHKSADWLQRLLRSYLRKGKQTGTLAIPPAFGGGGVAADDIDGDGKPDILLVSGTGLGLYRNAGHGKFQEMTEGRKRLGANRPDGTFGEPRQPLIADFNNDGLQDILVTFANDQHQLFRNRGNWHFDDVTATAGLGGASEVGGPAVTFDFDGDGLLDIYIGNFGDYPRGKLPTLSRRNDNGLPNKLFKNEGNFRFRDVTKGSGLDNRGWTQALGHTDLDGDGRQDVIVGNDFGINSFYRNLGGGRFEDIAAKVGTDKPSFTMNVGLADLNRDRLPDVYISNIVTMVKDDKYVAPTEDTPMHWNPRTMARMRVVEANDLFLSVRSKSPETSLQAYELSTAVGRGFSSTGWAWDADFFDFDHDGDDDLYCLNGMNDYNVYSDQPYYTSVFDKKATIQLVPAEPERNVFFVNEGGKLLNQSKESGLDFLSNARSAAYLDIDDDGDLDVVINNYHGKAQLARNDLKQPGNHYIKLRLVGDVAKGSNRDAIGARLLVATSGGTVWREVHGGIGYLSQHPKTQHVGLGAKTTADVEIRWPNGEVEQYRGLKADQLHTIVQGSAG